MQLTDTVIAQLLIPCFMETKGRNCRGYRNVFNPSNKKPSSPGVPTRLKIARIILNQQPTASRLLHHMIAKLLESNGWFQHEVFIWPKSDCSYLICFRKKTHFSPHITAHHQKSHPAAIAPSSVKTTSNTKAVQSTCPSLPLLQYPLQGTIISQPMEIGYAFPQVSL